MGYEELKTHGKSDFPFELYLLNKSNPKYVMAHHYHTFIEIILVTKGTLNVLLDSRKYTAKLDKYRCAGIKYLYYAYMKYKGGNTMDAGSNSGSIPGRSSRRRLWWR